MTKLTEPVGRPRSFARAAALTAGGLGALLTIAGAPIGLLLVAAASVLLWAPRDP